jgi:ABC-type hemin transport system ATPase subunit
MSEEKMKKKAKAATKPANKTAAEKWKANTVNGKKALYQQTAANFQFAAREMLESGIRALQEGARDMQAGIDEMQLSIKEQMNKYKEGAAALQSGVADMLSGIAAMRSSIVKQIEENQEYVKKFYG